MTMRPLLQSKRPSTRGFTILCVSVLSFLLALVTDFSTKAHAHRLGSLPAKQSLTGGTDSSGCLSCHTSTDEPTMHPTKTVHLTCTDCHGGNALIAVAPGIASNSEEYFSAKEKAH